MSRILVSLFLLGSIAPAFATDHETGPWSGNVAVGYLATTGNTEDTSASLDFLVAYALEKWKHELTGTAFGASTGDESTAEAYSLGWKSTYDIDARNYAFGAVDWNKDRFSGYRRQLFETVGYGRRILKTDTHVLNVEVGLGATQQKLVTGEDEDGTVATLGGDYRWNISETTVFSQTLDIFASSDNTYWESVSKLKANIIGNVALALAYTIKQNTDVPPGVDKTDTLTSIALDYSF